MWSKTEDFLVELETCDIEKNLPRSFELYEEYSQRDINETIRTRRDYFEKADVKVKRELETKVGREIKDFRNWLEETKNLESSIAHYYSTSLKSMLLGLPVGVRLACLFGTLLDTQVKD